MPKSSSNTIWWIVGSVTVVGLGTGAYFYLTRDKSDSPEKPATSSGSSSTSGSNTPTVRYEIGIDPWDMRYKDDVANSGISIKLMGDKKALTLAKRIRNAPGWDDDEQAVYDSINALESWVQLSQLSGVFYREYKKDLYKFIDGFFSDSEMTELQKYVKQLSKY